MHGTSSCIFKNGNITRVDFKKCVTWAIDLPVLSMHVRGIFLHLWLCEVDSSQSKGSLVGLWGIRQRLMTTCTSWLLCLSEGLYTFWCIMSTISQLCLGKVDEAEGPLD